MKASPLVRHEIVLGRTPVLHSLSSGIPWGTIKVIEIIDLFCSAAGAKFSTCLAQQVTAIKTLKVAQFDFEEQSRILSCQKA